ncbi:hypothetical protein ACERIT_06565 [Halopenitus sp. H-Gu1]|uniref:hypothetical protein n=1 Tax=Halopenitus sp. H-Gu1 TaxID=3242697 RepID=UPI00359D416C
MESKDPLNPRQSAIATAEELREDLETIASSDLPFAYDAEQILEAIDRAKVGANR